MLKKRYVIPFIGLTSFIILLFSMYHLMNSRTFQLFGGLTSNVETSQKAVALTFDDGPAGNTDEISAILDKYHAKGTFFLIGDELENHTEEGQMIAEAGHQIGNHTYSHSRMIFKSPSFIKEEIEKTNNLIRLAGYEGEIDFRPPNGKKLALLPYYLNKRQMDTITWDIEPDTYYSSISDKVRYVTEKTEPGSIILLHPMYDKLKKVMNSLR